VGVIAINEVIVHGWDIARASGQSFTADPRLVQAAYGFVQESVRQILRDCRARLARL